MEKTAQILKTLGHVERLRILSLLSHGELTVSELVQILGLSQPRITQYINSLESVGMSAPKPLMLFLPMSPMIADSLGMSICRKATLKLKCARLQARGHLT